MLTEESLEKHLIDSAVLNVLNLTFPLSTAFGAKKVFTVMINEAHS